MSSSLIFSTISLCHYVIKMTNLDKYLDIQGWNKWIKGKKFHNFHIWAFFSRKTLNNTKTNLLKVIFSYFFLKKSFPSLPKWRENVPKFFQNDPKRSYYYLSSVLGCQSKFCKVSKEFNKNSKIKNLHKFQTQAKNAHQTYNPSKNSLNIDKRE